MMSNEQIEKALTKAYQVLIFKGKIDFRINIEQRIEGLTYNETGSLVSSKNVIYNIFVYFTVDHAKLWGSSSEFSREYNSLINNINSYEDKMEDVIKYVLPTEEYVLWVLYEHYNTDVYKPLLDKLGELGLSFISSFMESTPTMEVILGIENEDTHSDIYNKLEVEEHFDVDDIIMYFDDLSN